MSSCSARTSLLFVRWSHARLQHQQLGLPLQLRACSLAVTTTDRPPDGYDLGSSASLIPRPPAQPGVVGPPLIGLSVRTQGATKFPPRRREGSGEAV